MVKLEHELYTHLEAQLAGIGDLVDTRISGLATAVDSRLNDLDWRLRDLGTCFANALDMESKLRTQDVGELREHLRVELAAASSNAATAAKAAANRAFEDDLIGTLEGLKQKLSDDLQEQHTRAALDLAERHLEVARALDARAEELSDSQGRCWLEAAAARAAASAATAA